MALIPSLFGGNKSGGKKSSPASEAFKQKMGAKLGKEQTFQQRLDSKVEKDIGDYLKARSASAAARGEKNYTPEISKNTKTMLKILAGQKLQKEIKKEKAQALAVEKQKKKEKQAMELAKRNAQYQADLVKARELEAQQQNKSYFFGYTEQP
ncbi:MAG TPA: hypothetical protein VFT64_04170 [Rickettsiales bacterium]|nr:hypothetical protein [Rickettsiales bacterium]